MTRKGSCARRMSNSSGALQRSKGRWRNAEKNRKTPRSKKWTPSGMRRRPRNGKPAAKLVPAVSAELRPHLRGILGIGTHRDAELAILCHVLCQHLCMAIEPAQACAVRRIETNVERLPDGAKAFLYRRQ